MGCYCQILGKENKCKKQQNCRDFRKTWLNVTREAMLFNFITYQVSPFTFCSGIYLH